MRYRSGRSAIILPLSPFQSKPHQHTARDLIPRWPLRCGGFQIAFSFQIAFRMLFDHVHADARDLGLDTDSTSLVQPRPVSSRTSQTNTGRGVLNPLALAVRWSFLTFRVLSMLQDDAHAHAAHQTHTSSPPTKHAMVINLPGWALGAGFEASEGKACPNHGQCEPQWRESRLGLAMGAPPLCLLMYTCN